MATNISTFTYKDQDIEVLFHKGKISYVFEIAGKRYGNAVKIEGTKKLDTITAAFALIINFIETYEAAKGK